jgi:hypothetical protein
MPDDSVRNRLMDLIVHRDPPTDLKRASLACGKNHAYLHQFVHRGTPRRLPEHVRYALASHLGVDQSVLRDGAPLAMPLDPHPNPPRANEGAKTGIAEQGQGTDHGQVFVRELRVRNSAKAKGPPRPEEGEEHWSFPLGWVQHVLKSQPAALRVVNVDGDAMEPSFRSGDQLLIDTDRRAPSPPGVFVIFDGVGLIPRSLEFLPNSEPPVVLIHASSDLVRDVEVPLVNVQIIGRAVWHARRL